MQKMNLTIFVLTLISGILNATWNFFSKKKSGDYSVMVTGLALSHLIILPAGIMGFVPPVPLPGSIAIPVPPVSLPDNAVVPAPGGHTAVQYYSIFPRNLRFNSIL